MKIFILTLLLVSASISFAQDDFIETVNSSKQSLKNKLDTLKYDGSKVTYFKYRDQTYYKGIQIPVFLRENYYFLVSGLAAEDKVSVEFYDKPPESEDRILLYEIKNISGDEDIVNVDELIGKLAFYGKSPELLRSVFIDYVIKKSKSDRGAIVLVLGY